MAQIEYYPPTSQPYQYKILVYEGNTQFGSRAIEYFRNDHEIQTNPNIIMTTLSSRCSHSGQTGANIVINNEKNKINIAILQSDIIVFHLTKLNVQQLQHLLKIAKFTKDKNKKIIVVSSLFTWKSRQSTSVISKQDILTRLPINSTFKQLQNLCLDLKNKNNLVSPVVISTGLIYGMGQNQLFYKFKQALEQKQPLKVYGTGKNKIPTVHVDDLVQLVFDLSFSKRQGYFICADKSKITQLQLNEVIAKTVGNGKVEVLSIQQGFLDPYFDIFTSDIQIKDGSLEQISIWKYQSGLIKNIGNVVGQFNQCRGLKPNKIVINGPPVSGKSKIAQILAKQYGLPILSIKQLVEDAKSQDNQFGYAIKALYEDLRAIKEEQQRKTYQQIKKKKKGKGMEEFDPSKIVVRLPDTQICKIVKKRLFKDDCLNKGYILDGVLKSTSQYQNVFLSQNGKIIEQIFPNSVFSIEATQEQVKARVKTLKPQVVEGTHWNEQSTVRRFVIYKKNNETEKWASFFQGKVDIQAVPLDYPDQSIFVAYVQRNGPLGFKNESEVIEQKIQNNQQQNQQTKNQNQKQENQEQQQQKFQQFDLQKLTESQTKILNQKSRPIRQYLIDNVIPQITEGLLEICKQTPADPINFLIGFLQTKRKKSKNGK